MENLIFSLNATVPVFLMMVIGMVLRKVGWVDEDFASKANKFVFRLPLPFLLFSDLATVDFTEVWDLKFVLFLRRHWRVLRSRRACHSCFRIGRSEENSYRSRIEAALHFGIALIQNIYGSAGMAPLMILASVPLYNVMAVTVLSLYRPGEPESSSAMMKRTLKESRQIRSFWHRIWYGMVRASASDAARAFSIKRSAVSERWRRRSDSLRWGDL